MGKVVLHTYYRAKFQETVQKSSFVHERGNSGSSCEGIVFYLFKLTSFCTDGRTEEAYLRKSYRAEFKLELANLTFDSSKITLLSTSLRQGHPSFCVISPPFERRTHAYCYDSGRNHGHEVTRTKTKLNWSIIDLGSRSTATTAAVQKKFAVRSLVLHG